MKRLIYIGIIIPLLFSSTAFAQQSVVKLTRYSGEKISGVSASSAFDVYLEQSNRPRVVAEISEDLEERLQVVLGPDGIVRISLAPGRNRTSRSTVMKVTVYLPELTYLRGAGAVTIRSSGNFTSKRTEIVLSGASDLKSLNLDTDLLKISCSGASDASIKGSAGEMDIQLTGASDLNMELDPKTECRTAKIKCEGASDLDISGGGAKEALLTASSGSDADMSQFAVKQLKVTASGASDVKVWAVDSIEASSSSASSIRYKGNPPSYDTKTSSAGSIRKIN